MKCSNQMKTQQSQLFWPHLSGQIEYIPNSLTANPINQTLHCWGCRTMGCFLSWIGVSFSSVSDMQIHLDFLSTHPREQSQTYTASWQTESRMGSQCFYRSEEHGDTGMPIKHVDSRNTTDIIESKWVWEFHLTLASKMIMRQVQRPQSEKYYQQVIYRADNWKA